MGGQPATLFGEVSGRGGERGAEGARGAAGHPRWTCEGIRGELRQGKGDGGVACRLQRLLRAAEEMAVKS